MFLLSLPMRGAWIEIYFAENVKAGEVGRSPCGERGLKCKHQSACIHSEGSLPMRGAWIEISALIVF